MDSITTAQKTSAVVQDKPEADNEPSEAGVVFNRKTSFIEDDRVLPEALPSKSSAEQPVVASKKKKKKKIKAKGKKSVVITEKPPENSDSRRKTRCAQPDDLPSKVSPFSGQPSDFPPLGSPQPPKTAVAHSESGSKKQSRQQELMSKLVSLESKALMDLVLQANRLSTELQRFIRERQRLSGSERQKHWQDHNALQHEAVDFINTSNPYFKDLDSAISKQLKSGVQLSKSQTCYYAAVSLLLDCRIHYYYCFAELLREGLTQCQIIDLNEFLKGSVENDYVKNFFHTMRYYTYALQALQQQENLNRKILCTGQRDQQLTAQHQSDITSSVYEMIYVLFQGGKAVAKARSHKNPRHTASSVCHDIHSNIKAIEKLCSLKDLDNHFDLTGLPASEQCIRICHRLMAYHMFNDPTLISDSITRLVRLFIEAESPILDKHTLEENLPLFTDVFQTLCGQITQLVTEGKHQKTVLDRCKKNQRALYLANHLQIWWEQIHCRISSLSEDESYAKLLETRKKIEESQKKLQVELQARKSVNIKWCDELKKKPASASSDSGKTDRMQDAIKAGQKKLSEQHKVHSSTKLPESQAGACAKTTVDTDVRVTNQPESALSSVSRHAIKANWENLETAVKLVTDFDKRGETRKLFLQVLNCAPENVLPEQILWAQYGLMDMFCYGAIHQIKSDCYPAMKRIRQYGQALASKTGQLPGPEAGRQFKSDMQQLCEAFKKIDLYIELTRREFAQLMELIFTNEQTLESHGEVMSATQDTQIELSKAISDLNNFTDELDQICLNRKETFKGLRSQQPAETSVAVPDLLEQIKKNSQKLEESKEVFYEHLRQDQEFLSQVTGTE